MKLFILLFPKRKNTDRCAGIAAAVMLFMILFANAAIGDVIDDSLSPDSPQAVKDSARHAIQSGLQQDNVVKLTRAMLQNEFDEHQIQLTLALMIEAKNGSMPVQPIMNKAFEGMAKGVEPSLIMAAMATVQSRNVFAYQLVAQLSKNNSQTANLGSTLSSALAAGFAKEDAEKIMQKIQQRAQSMNTERAYSLALECFKTAQDVSRLGVSSQAVTNMLAGALNKGFNHQDMRAMRNAFMTQARQFQPQNLARSYSAAIEEGKGFQGVPGGGAGSSGTSGGNAGGGSTGSGGSGDGGGSGGSGGAGGSGPGGGGAGGNK
ncbi:MAG: hypothetical protein PVF29_11270 [Desulfobacterales bacterium]|jgi:hypothetical protein